jgi:hypothetical protein
MIEPNVTLQPTRRGFRVLVGDTKVAGVTRTEIVQPTKERVGPDGWRLVEKDGDVEVVIRIPVRFVRFAEQEQV